MDTQAQQLSLHFSLRTYATFSAAWSSPGLGLDTSMPPVYSISQVWPSWGLLPTRSSWPMHILNLPVTSVRQTLCEWRPKGPQSVICHRLLISLGLLALWQSVGFFMREFLSRSVPQFRERIASRCWHFLLQLLASPLKPLPHCVCGVCIYMCRCKPVGVNEETRGLLFLSTLFL